MQKIFCASHELLLWSLQKVSDAFEQMWITKFILQKSYFGLPYFVFTCNMLENTPSFLSSRLTNILLTPSAFLPCQFTFILLLFYLLLFYFYFLSFCQRKKKSLTFSQWRYPFLLSCQCHHQITSIPPPLLSASPYQQDSHTRQANIRALKRLTQQEAPF